MFCWYIRPQYGFQKLSKHRMAITCSDYVLQWPSVFRLYEALRLPLSPRIAYERQAIRRLLNLWKPCFGSRVCTGGVRTEKPLLPEEPSSSTLYLTLYELELIDSDSMTPRERTQTVSKKIVEILQEVPENPLRIRDVARLISNWESWQKLILADHGVLQILLDVVRQHSDDENRRPVDTRPRRSFQADFSPKTRRPSHGVGYATGSTSTQFNLKKLIDKRRRSQAILIACLRALRACVAKLDVDAVAVAQPDRIIFEAISVDRGHISVELKRQLQRPDFIQFLGQLFDNQSILDVSEHVELYTAAMQFLVTISLFSELGYVLIRPQVALEKNLFEYITEFRENVTLFYSQMNRNYAFDEDRFIIFVNRMESWYRTLKTSLSYLHGVSVEDAKPTLSIAVCDTSTIVTDEAKYVRMLTPYQVAFFEFVTEQALRFTYTFDKDAASIHPFSIGLAGRMSRITKEIAALKNSLPLTFDSAVFVAIDESRSDILKVLITGPRDTPYEDGCFELDVFFPKNYPANPPKVRLATTGNGTVRFNPNLYNDGKICLSILNTWEGRPEERWNPSFSLLQVLVSIQALIFVPEPYFNEPGFEKVRGSTQAQQESTAYNARLRLATIQHAMVSYIVSPPPYFEDIMKIHFYSKRNQIVQRAREWGKTLKLKDEPLPDDLDELKLDWMPLNSTQLNIRLGELEKRLSEMTPPDAFDFMP